VYKATWSLSKAKQSIHKIIKRLKLNKSFRHRLKIWARIISCLTQVFMLSFISSLRGVQKKKPNQLRKMISSKKRNTVI